MTDKEQRQAAKRFAQAWKGKGYEKGQSQAFWLSLLREVLGVEHPEEYILFEEQVHLDHTSFIDGRIPKTKVLIEQKSLGKDLNKPIKQSDGSLLNPFQQAKKYIANLPVSQHPRWVVTCNFAEFYVYDMERPGGEPEKILLADLEKDYYRLNFLADEGNTTLKRELEVSIAAGEIVGLLYDALLKQYKNPSAEETLHSLNILCVRLVFCLYAEDAGVFGRHGMFHDYLAEYNARQTRKALIELFEVLDTEPSKRDAYLQEDSPALAAFPYVNGGLFSAENVEVPPFTDEIRDILLTKASADFNWSDISPTIFGAVFESTLNPQTRRLGGMHYTSIENIHKVIDPLFLDDLKKEFEDIKAIAVENTRKKKLAEFQNKLGSLTFLDPACGSGNFLTETYMSLRRLENNALRLASGGQFFIPEHNPIKVSISRFYGIEINDFAVTVAKTALWIAESQMLKETEDIIHKNLDFLPLKTNAHIIEGNALRMNWENVVPKDTLKYIMGNPPFVGARLMTRSQKDDIKAIFQKRKGTGNLDYVSAWYEKAASFIKGTNINVAFVSTNSISQGEQVAILWKPLFENGIVINFAWPTFKWASDSNDPAAVSCVIIGYSNNKTKDSIIYYDTNSKIKTENINAYLLNAPNVFITNRSSSFDEVPAINYGSFALDDGNYTISEQEYRQLINEDKNIWRFMRPFIGAQELLHNKKRYCIWLKNISPSEINSSRIIKQKIKLVKEWRSRSLRKNTVALADTPTLFAEIRQPTAKYLAIPTVCSEKRRYIPMAYLEPAIIASNQLYIVGNATIYHFGVLTSNVHMAWMRAVCGRLETRYRYSSAVVYNNFPWPKPTDAQKAAIEKTAQAILDARALYPESSLADLYDDLAMPPELRKAHQQNDCAVMQAYGFSLKMTESECVAKLMELYKSLAEGA